MSKELKGWMKLATARRELLRKVWYFAKAIRALSPVEMPGLGTVGVTPDMVLLVDLEFTDSLSLPALVAALAHEVSHVLRDSHGRCVRHKMEPALSNIASDIAINHDLVLAGLSIKEIKGVCLPETYGFRQGLTHEAYYDLLKKRQQDKQPNKPMCGAGWCGSGGGRPIPGEPKDNGNKDGKEHVGRSPAEVEAVRRGVAQDIRDGAKGRGNVPGGWMVWAETELKEPVVPWQTKIIQRAHAALRTKQGAVDLRFRGVSRRQAGLGYGPGVAMLPTYRAPIPEVLICADTSGSMSRTDHQKGFSELVGIVRAVGAQVQFMAVDTEVHSLVSIDKWQDAAKALKGGGGTDFTKAFETINKMKNPPHLVIWYTDGDAVVRVDKPKYPVIWLITSGSDRAPVPWGEVIKL